jgi:4-aminobutyrate aminotransferase-like enzyme
VIDVDDNKYIDFCFTLAASLGHGHVSNLNAASQALSSISNTSVYLSAQRIELSELVLMTLGHGFGGCQFLSSGAEAIETALWYARRITGRRGALSFFGGYHGKTHHAASLGRIAPWHGERSPGFIAVPYADCRNCFFGASFPDCEFRCVRTLPHWLKGHLAGDVAAVVIEAIQGGAVTIPPPGYLVAVRKFCDEQGLVLIIDEILTGLGRCGAHLTCLEDGVVPDIAVIGKGLANGLPIAAVVVQARHLESLADVVGSTTYGGNPFCCSVAHECVARLVGDRLAARASELEGAVRSCLNALRDCKCIGDVRGRGLLFGLEFADMPSAGLTAGEICRRAGVACLQRGVLTFAADSVLQLAPALTIDQSTLHDGLGLVVEAVRATDCALVQDSGLERPGVPG